MKLLERRTAIITGAGRLNGLGFSTAKLMAEHGAQVTILDLAGADKAAEALGIGHRGLSCDVTDPAQCQHAADQVMDAEGQVDILVNNAGISQPLKIMEIGQDDYQAVMDVNLRGTLNMSQAVIPAMQQATRGAIVNMSSVSAQRGGGIFGGPHYSAAKAGILGLTKAMARELAPDGIRVNAVCPGFIGGTDITEGKLTAKMLADITSGIPMARPGRADEVAGCCVFLASDLSSYVTGAELDVNGGSLIH